MELPTYVEKVSTKDIQEEERQLVLLYNECIQFIDCFGPCGGPGIDVTRRMAGSIQDEVFGIRKKLWEESDVQLGPEFYDIDPGVALCDALPGSSWWEGASILESSSASLHARLLDLRPPKNSVAYANYIGNLMKNHLTYHGRRPARMFEVDMEHYFQYEQILRRACEEIQRIYDDMPNGRLLALDLYLELKLNILQAPAATVLDWAQTGHHTYVTKMISKTLKSSIPHHTFPPSTFTRYCRLIKERMRRLRCTWGHDGKYSKWIQAETRCVHNMLIPDLDLFQRYAYFEVRDSVHLAIAKRLPAELVMLVFEQIMAAEGLSLDPRVLVNAYRAESTPTTALKSRLECSHLLLCPREWSGRFGYGCTEPDEYGPEYVVGQEWKEISPHFPHSQIRDMDDMIALDIHCDKACAC